MKLVTFNIRCSWNGDGINSFLHRAGFIFKKINDEKPDIIAFQEVTEDIFNFLRNMLCSYEMVGHGRDKDYFGEGIYFAYRRETVRLFGLECYWLSDTPNVSASRYSGQSIFSRICLDGLFCMGKTIFRVCNVHFDHMAENKKIREKEAEQIIKNIMSKDGDRFPCFILGDFNAVKSEECIKIFEKNGFIDAANNVGMTFHNFEGKKYKNASKIDYIFTDKKTYSKLKKVKKWTDESDGIFLSDHYPICAEFVI